MINFKQRELSQQLFDHLKTKYPEIDLIKITESYETPEDVWVHISVPQDDQREIEIIETSAEISTDMLINYGYHITIFPASQSEKLAMAA